MIKVYAFHQTYRPLVCCSYYSMKFSTKSKKKIELDKNISENLENELYKPRHHPGVDRKKSITLPEQITKAIFKSTRDQPIKQIWKEAESLCRYLKARHIPAERSDIVNKSKTIEKDVEFYMNADLITAEDENYEKLRKQIDNKVKRTLQQRTYSWKAINYDSSKALQYLLGRSPSDYATLLRIFSEISARRPDWQPRSFFDFGSGVGTGSWAASELWKKSIFEYYLVDASKDMNNLADRLLRGGDDNKELSLKNVYFRQFLPASTDLRYDIVLSAYSLFELPNVKSRLEVLLTLWNKCDGYLVIVEQGTRAGFKLVNEARDFILYISRNTQNAQVFSPCAHNMQCPRYIADDGTPCNFLSQYTPLEISDVTGTRKDLYSYVVIKKGDASEIVEEDKWPRLVRPTLVRARHSICRMCSSNGKLEELIFTQAKNGKYPYRCARSSNWGDRLPISVMEEVNNTDPHNPESTE